MLALLVVGGIIYVSSVGTNLSSSSSGSSTGSSPDAPYQNDQYKVPAANANPPALPQPQTYAEAEKLITANTFYQQAAPAPVRCDLQPINVATADDAQLKSHFETLMACVVRVWEPPVVGAGYQIVRPSVTIYGSQVTTRCGKTEVNAFYCSADQQVYFSNRLADYVPIVKTDKWAADVVMAHEFGHALQARTGILISANALSQNSSSNSTQLELSRRLETQADCFSGMFTNSVSESLGIQQSDRAGILDTYTAVGDDTVSGKATIVGNHGLAKTRRYWGGTGLGTTAISKCNTFTASSAQVR